MSARHFDDLPALGEIREALAREVMGLIPASAPASRRRPRFRAVRALPVLVGAIVPVVVLVMALVLLGGGRSPRTADRAGDVPGRQALIDELAVLRRPQTKSDLAAFMMRGGFQRPGLRGRPDMSLIRYATTTPWGARVYIVPFQPPTAAQLARMSLRFPAGLRRQIEARGETVGVFTQGGGGGGANAATVRNHGSGITEGAAHWTRIVNLVPDGVASVTFVIPRQPQPGVPFAPTYRTSVSITVPVRENVAAVQIDRTTGGGDVPMIWRNARGHVIKRIGNFSRINRIVAAPRPGPQTAASRAAERDPATPNRVWVTPAIGGPRTDFKYHFQLLLNDADYRYRLTGPTCPGIHVDGDGDGGASGLRGRLWTDSVSAISTARWCPGTYHLSAFIFNYGLHGRQSGRVRVAHETRSFGTATFTVRP